MILGLTINNFMAFSSEVELSLIADMRIKKFASNVNMNTRFNVLKSACIFGANNVGKTCMTSAVATVKNVLLNIPANVTPNVFTDNRVCSIEVSFLYDNIAYKYEFKFDSSEENSAPRGFIYERFSELSCDTHRNITENEIFVRDVENQIFRFREIKTLTDMLKLVSSANILIYTVNTELSPVLSMCKKILRGFAESVEIFDMNNIPINKTLENLRSDGVVRNKTVELIKLADLDIEDFYIKENVQVPTVVDIPKEIEAKIRPVVKDMLKLTSVHKGIEFRSFELDSMGTKKVIAAAGFIVSALMNGSTIVIDELDSSLHFKITRALVALFNNEKNLGGQLIFTAHDATLLDCRRLFRKDQLWFIAKDTEGIYVYSLADFTAQNSGVRSGSDILEKYSAGVLGAVPEPDLISVLLDED